MGTKEFGQLLSDRMEELGLSQNRLASRLGELPDGRIFDATQIRMLREGRRRIDHVLVARLIEVLGWDADSATELGVWETAGLWPPGISVDDISELRAARLMAATRAAQPVEGASSAAAASSSSEPPDLMRACAPSAGQPLPEAA